MNDLTLCFHLARLFFLLFLCFHCGCLGFPFPSNRQSSNNCNQAAVAIHSNTRFGFIFLFHWVFVLRSRRLGTIPYHSLLRRFFFLFHHWSFLNLSSYAETNYPPNFPPFLFRKTSFFFLILLDAVEVDGSSGSRSVGWSSD